MVYKVRWSMTLIGFLGVSILLIIFSHGVKQAMEQGVMLCLQVLIPALFPFVVLTEWVKTTPLTQWLAKLFSPVFYVVMGKCASCGIALLLCLLGGYPMGASAIKHLYDSKTISIACAKRLSLWIFCPSPGFVIVAVGQGMLQSSFKGLIVWLACVISTLLIGRIICCFTPACKATYSFQTPVSLTRTLQKACEIMTGLCSVVVLFSGFFALVMQLPIGKQNAFLVAALGEVTAGCSNLIQGGASLPMIGFVLSFGGVCTHFQCKMILGNGMAGFGWFWLVRLVQSAVCYGLLTGFCRLFPQTATVFSTVNEVSVGEVSWLPGLALLFTCIVFLCSVHKGKEEVL